MAGGRTAAASEETAAAEEAFTARETAAFLSPAFFAAEERLVRVWTSHRAGRSLLGNLLDPAIERRQDVAARPRVAIIREDGAIANE